MVMMTQIVRKRVSSYAGTGVSPCSNFIKYSGLWQYRPVLGNAQNKRHDDDLIIMMFTLLQNYNVTMGQSSVDVYVLIVQRAVF